MRALPSRLKLLEALPLSAEYHGGTLGCLHCEVPVNLACDISPGLCASCVHREIIRSSRGSAFYRCRLSEMDRRFPKYPRLPVIQCSGWSEKLPAKDQDQLLDD